MSRTARVVAAATLALAAGAVVAAATGFGLRDTGEGTRAANLPPATAKLTRQTLLDRQTESGELTYRDETTVSNRVAGTLTWLPGTGSAVRRGQALYRVDDKPVVLLYGTLPAYRTLAGGARGTDVRQFEQNLWALGYRGFTVDKKYTGATAGAVKEWQEDLGLAETGTVEPGRIVYAGEAVRVSTHKLAKGGPLGTGTAVLNYTGRSRVVTVELEVSDQRLARKGAAVRVKLPDGKTVDGRISKVQTVIDPGSGEEEATTKIEVTVTIAGTPVAGLDQASVDVDFTAAQRKNVLTVPVAALLALSEGGYGIQVVEHGATRIVPVETGLFADGRVEVSGSGMTEGMTVGVPA